MNYTRKFWLVFALLFAIVFTAGCNGGNGIDQQQQVSSGETVYNDSCALCHEPGGTGPELNASTLAAYGTAEGLHDYISQSMPLDDPGSLSEEEYYDVTAFLLSREGLLPAETVVGPDTAGEISLSQ